MIRFYSILSNSLDNHQMRIKFTDKKFGSQEITNTRTSQSYQYENKRNNIQSLLKNQSMMVEFTDVLLVSPQQKKNHFCSKHEYYYCTILHYHKLLLDLISALI